MEVQKKRAQTAPRIRYTWGELSMQFREIARMFTAIEDRVWSEGKVNAKELTSMATSHHLSEMGAEVLTSMVRQSERIQIEEDGEDVWLLPNPEYVPNEDDLEDAITGVHEAPRVEVKS